MNKQAEEHDTLEKLKRMLDGQEMEIFDKREVDTIRRMISTFEAFESFGRLGNAVRSVVIWLGVMLAAYFAVTEWFIKFIRAKAGSP